MGNLIPQLIGAGLGIIVATALLTTVIITRNYKDDRDGKFRCIMTRLSRIEAMLKQDRPLRQVDDWRDFNGKGQA